MKFKTLLLATLGLIALSCQKPAKLGDPKVEIKNTAEISLAQEGGEADIQIISTLDWKLKDYTDEIKSWLVITPSEGKASNEVQTIHLRAIANEGGNRQAVINIYGNVLYNATVTVVQNGPKGDIGSAEAVTVAEFLRRADNTKEYLLEGKISRVTISDKFKGFDLADNSGSVQVVFPKNIDAHKDKLTEGSTVKIRGKYKLYKKTGKPDTPEMVDGTIIEVQTYVEDPSKVVQISVAEFISKADKFTTYRLKGKVVSQVDPAKCSFDLKDESGTIFVYSVKNAGEWASKVKKYGTVTLRGKYDYYESQSKHEVVGAYIEAFEEGESNPLPENLEGKGTAEEPFTCSDVAKILAAEAAPAGNVYTKGILYNIEDINTGTYGNATFRISDKGDEKDFVRAFRSLYLDKKKFTSKDQIVIGDELVLCGALALHEESGNKFSEIANGYIHSRKPASSHMSVSKKSIFVTASMTNASFDIKSNVAWTVSCEDASFSFDKASGTGDASVTVTFPANETAVAKNVKIKVSTTAAVIIKEFAINFTQAAKQSGKNYTFKVDDVKGLFVSEKDTKYNAGFAADLDGLKVAYYKNTSNTEPVSPAEVLRVYKNYVLSLTAPVGKKIEKVLLTTPGDDKGKYCLDMTVELGGGTAKADKSKLTITWTPEAAAERIVAKASTGQVRISDISVTYAE